MQWPRRRLTYDVNCNVRVEKALPVIHEQLVKPAMWLAVVLNLVLGQN